MSHMTVATANMSPPYVIQSQRPISNQYITFTWPGIVEALAWKEKRLDFNVEMHNFSDITWQMDEKANEGKHKTEMTLP